MADCLQINNNSNNFRNTGKYNLKKRQKKQSKNKLENQKKKILRTFTANCARSSIAPTDYCFSNHCRPRFGIILMSEILKLNWLDNFDYFFNQILQVRFLSRDILHHNIKCHAILGKVDTDWQVNGLIYLNTLLLSIF